MSNWTIRHVEGKTKYLIREKFIVLFVSEQIQTILIIIKSDTLACNLLFLLFY